MKHTSLLAPILAVLLQAKVGFAAPQNESPSYGHVGRVSYDKMEWGKSNSSSTDRMLYVEGDYTGTQWNRVTLICGFPAQWEEERLGWFSAVVSSGQLNKVRRTLYVSQDKVDVEFPGVSATFTQNQSNVSIIDRRIHALMSTNEVPPTPTQAKEMQATIREMCVHLYDEMPVVGDGSLAKEVRARIGRIYTGNKSDANM